MNYNKISNLYFIIMFVNLTTSHYKHASLQPRSNHARETLTCSKKPRNLTKISQKEIHCIGFGSRIPYDRILRGRLLIPAVLVGRRRWRRGSTCRRCCLVNCMMRLSVFNLSALLLVCFFSSSQPGRC